MKALYEGMERPDKWAVFKFKPLEDDSLAVKEFERLTNHYESISDLFINLKGQMRAEYVERNLCEALGGLALGCLVSIIFTPFKAYWLVPLSLHIYFIIVSRIHHQRFILVDRILFYWMLRNQTDLSRIKIGKNRIFIEVG